MGHQLPEEMVCRKINCHRHRLTGPNSLQKIMNSVSRSYVSVGYKNMWEKSAINTQTIQGLGFRSGLTHYLRVKAFQYVYSITSIQGFRGQQGQNQLFDHFISVPFKKKRKDLANSSKNCKNAISRHPRSSYQTLE